MSDKAIGTSVGLASLFSSRPSNVGEATASLQKNINDLNYVHELRQGLAEEKTREISRLTKERAEDESESKMARRLSDKLSSFLFGDEG